MHPNEALIVKFYTAFQQLDYTTMQQCYSDDAIFNDPAFGLMDADHTRAMWKMLCTRAKDFSLRFGDIKILDEEYATCKWEADYLFSQTGRKVHNTITAHMRIQNGLITEHTDDFNLYRWSRMALGLKGILLGWTGFVQNKIRLNARRSLENFMQQ